MPNVNKIYSQQEVDFIKQNYSKLSVKEISVILNRSAKSVRAKIERLGLSLATLDRNAPYQWSKNELDFLQANYLTLSDAKLSKRLNIPISIVCRKRLQLGLRIHHYNEYIEDGYAKRYINGKKVWVHRYNAEAKYGREISKTEKVHHINGDKLDNRMENLYVCTDKSHHSRVHGSLEKVAFALIKKGIIKFDESNGVYHL